MNSALPGTILTAALLLGGCSMRQMALDQTAGILKDALPAFEKEWDFELVAEALPGSIKIMEGFLQSGPGNPDLLLLTAQAYTSYALVILEDRWERAEEDSEEADRLAHRTREMYLRGHRFGLRLLELRHPGFSKDFATDSATIERRLAACTPEDVPGLFWAGMPLVGAVNISRNDVTMISYMPKGRALIQRALALNEGYYHAGSHMILGSLYGSLGPSLGGDPVKAQKHLERALELTERRFLLVQVMYAKTLAVQNQDLPLFKKMLNEVLEAKLEIFPQQKLANVAAKRRARRLLQRADELF